MKMKNKIKLLLINLVKKFFIWLGKFLDNNFDYEKIKNFRRDFDPKKVKIFTPQYVMIKRVSSFYWKLLLIVICLIKIFDSESVFDEEFVNCLIYFCIFCFFVDITFMIIVILTWIDMVRKK